MNESRCPVCGLRGCTAAPKLDIDQIARAIGLETAWSAADVKALLLVLGEGSYYLARPLIHIATATQADPFRMVAVLSCESELSNSPFSKGVQGRGATWLAGLAPLFEPRPLDEWDQDKDGAVLWWKFPVEEPPYAGTPLDDDFPDYVTHFTAIPEVHEPAGGAA